MAGATQCKLEKTSVKPEDRPLVSFLIENKGRCDNMVPEEMEKATSQRFIQRIISVTLPI